MNIVLFILAWIASGSFSYLVMTYGMLLLEALQSPKGADRDRLKRRACEFTQFDAFVWLLSVIFAPIALGGACAVACVVAVAPALTWVWAIASEDKVLFRICRKHDR